MSDKKRIRKTFRAVEGDWRRADLHLHTPASADWLEPGVTYLQWLQKAESRGLDIVAITDHNTVEGVARMRAEVERLTWLEANDRLRPQERRDLDEYRRLGEKILVLPGFEFTATFGFHILAIFPPETPLRTLELLLLRLNVPIDRLAEGSTEVGATVDVLTAYRVIREAGGLVIAAHANSAHGVALQGLGLGGQTKIAFTQDPNLHALEVTDLESTSRRATARFFDGSKPEYPRRMHCIQGSDAHRLTRDLRDKNRLGIGDRVTEILLPEVSFEALLAVFEGDDFTRTRPYRPPAEVPFDHVEAAREQGNTIIQSFHESMAREGGRLHKILCDVVAFANTRGGTVYVGVSASRKGAPRGIENPESSAALLKKELERNITPPLEARVDVVQSLGAPILRITVPNGPDKPYALGQTRIYVRQEGETNEAVRDELVHLVLSGQRPAEPERPLAAAAPEGVQVAPPPQPAPEPAPVPVPAAPAPEEAPLPAIGVEILSVEERKGGRYFTIRDLRNGNVVQNVTLASARKLWSYAINQYLTNPVDPERVTWRGEFGLWQAARRARKLRYDLVLRHSEGGIRAFYGVTADGMTGPWAQFLQAEDRGGGEAEPQAAARGVEQIEPQAEAPVAVEAAAEAEVGAGAEAEVLAPSAEAAAEPGAVEAEEKRKSRSRRRKARPKAEAPELQPAEVPASDVPQEPVEVSTEPETAVPEAIPAESVASSAVSVEAPGEPAAAAQPAEPEPAQKATSRRRRQRKEASQAEAPAEAEVPAAPSPAAAEEVQPTKPRRTRSRKAQPKPEAAPGTEAA